MDPPAALPWARTVDPALVRSRNLYLAGLYVLALFAGLNAALLPREQMASDVLMRLLIGMALALVVVADARVLGRPWPFVVGLLTVLLWPIAAPGFVIARRGLRGLGWVLLHAVLGVVLAMAAYWVIG